MTEATTFIFAIVLIILARSSFTEKDSLGKLIALVVIAILSLIIGLWHWAEFLQYIKTL